MIEHLIIAGNREALDKVPADHVARASAILLAEPDGRYQVVKARYSDAARGAVFANKTAALRAVTL